jgi:hypothetical protein
VTDSDLMFIFSSGVMPPAGRRTPSLRLLLVVTCLLLSAISHSVSLFLFLLFLGGLTKEGWRTAIADVFRYHVHLTHHIGGCGDIVRLERRRGTALLRLLCGST